MIPEFLPARFLIYKKKEAALLFPGNKLVEAKILLRKALELTVRIV